VERVPGYFFELHSKLIGGVSSRSKPVKEFEPGDMEKFWFRGITRIADQFTNYPTIQDVFVVPGIAGQVEILIQYLLMGAIVERSTISKNSEVEEVHIFLRDVPRDS
jgi:hypothetical protein